MKRSLLLGLLSVLFLASACTSRSKEETAITPAQSAKADVQNAGINKPEETEEVTSTPSEIVLTGDYIEELIDKTEMEQRKLYGADFMITASTIHAYYQEENKLRVFVTTYYAGYNINTNYLDAHMVDTDEKTVTGGGGIEPACVTYLKNDTGEYILEEYKAAEDGGSWIESIHAYCVMPVSGKAIEGLAETIINDYSDHTSRSELNLERLREYLKSKGMEGYVLIDYEGAEPIPLT